jgi:hypothetical protein
MISPGSSRERLVRRLNAAYAGGLISDQTLVHRLDEVFYRRVVDPTSLVGDLHLRHGRGALQERVSRMMTAVVARLGALREDKASDRLLALDWNDLSSELIIGRSSDCDVYLPDSTVSRHHARLIFRDGCWVLQDLSSTNGSYLNGHRVSRCQLRPGDRLLLGHAALLVD